MPFEQLELSATRARRSAEPEDVLRFVAHLRGSGWMQFKVLAGLTGWNERKVRRIAAASAGEIISSDRGYKLLAEATPEEFLEFDGRLRSQAREMISRSLRARRRWHQFGRSP